MKLWRIPWPWDYHCQGALIVVADTKEKAIVLGKEYTSKIEYQHSVSPHYSEIKELDGLVTEDQGCDC